MYFKIPFNLIKKGDARGRELFSENEVDEFHPTDDIRVNGDAAFREHVESVIGLLKKSIVLVGYAVKEAGVSEATRLEVGAVDC